MTPPRFSIPHPVSFDQNIAEIFAAPCEDGFTLSPFYANLLNAADTKLDVSRSEIKGTCTSFAPLSEIARRERVISEKFEQGTLSHVDGQPRQLQPLKHYSRSAAGDTQHAGDILSPETLHRCLEYISDVLLQIPSKLNAEPNAEVKSEFFTFLDNRLRSLGKDYESQSIDGPVHMRDMGMTLRIYILRIFECTQTVADCGHFCTFKKLNNERMDAIQGVLLKYIHDARNTDFFNEIFSYFLLRSLGHDAELDARHWWPDSLSTRRQMLFKLASSPLCHTLCPREVYTSVQAIHFIETGQWLAYCHLMRKRSMQKLHTTLMGCSLPYVRVRALLEMHHGRALGARKPRYTGDLSADYVADALLFAGYADLTEFCALLNFNLSTGLLRCGGPEVKEVSCVKKAKQRFLRPVPLLQNGVDEGNLFDSSDSSKLVKGAHVRVESSRTLNALEHLLGHLNNAMFTGRMDVAANTLNIAQSPQKMSSGPAVPIDVAQTVPPFGFHQPQVPQNTFGFPSVLVPTEHSFVTVASEQSQQLFEAQSPIDQRERLFEQGDHSIPMEPEVDPPEELPTMVLDEECLQPCSQRQKRPDLIKSEISNTLHTQAYILQDWLRSRAATPKWAAMISHRFFDLSLHEKDYPAPILLRWIINFAPTDVVTENDVLRLFYYQSCFRSAHENSEIEIYHGSRMNSHEMVPVLAEHRTVMTSIVLFTDAQRLQDEIQQATQAHSLTLIHLAVVVQDESAKGEVDAILEANAHSFACTVLKQTIQSDSSTDLRHSLEKIAWSVGCDMLRHLLPSA